MILEELRLLKSFSNSMDSTITEQDIAAKERELEIKLPEALCDLYLTFNPDDPIFTTCRMVPLEKLTIRSAEDDQQYYQVIPILFGEKRAFGPAISAKRKYGADDPCWTWDGEELGLVLKANFPKNNSKPIQLVKGINGWSISVCILEVLGLLVIQSLNSLVGVQDKYSLKCRRSRHATHALLNVYARFSGIVPQARDLLIERKSGSILGLDLPAIIDFPYGGDSCGSCVFGADSDEPLEQLMRETGARLEWIRSQNGNVTPEEDLKTGPEERPLIPISPVLEYIRDFTGLVGSCTSKEEMERAEQKLGCQLPLALKEFYMYLPKTMFQSWDTIWNVSKLRLMKNGKIKFLEENQSSFYGAVSTGSSLMYLQWEKDWEPAGVLDGFLAVEFLDILLADHHVELVMDECQHIKEEQLLAQQFSELAGISSQIAVGNSKRLYEVCGGQGIAVYDSDSESLFLYAKRYDSLQNLLKALGLT